MNFVRLVDSEAAAQRGAAHIAQAAREAVRLRGSFLLALSGGHTPRRMFELLATEDVPWAATHVFQVDERVAPPGDPQRNATQLAEALLHRVAIPPDHVHLMPVEAPDLRAAAGAYARTLRARCGSPPTLDLVQLGLGADGHTASLVPGDPVLLETAADVALSGPYQGLQRMTLTYSALNGARQILWLVCGAEKTWALQRLRQGDPSIPAGRVDPARATLLADADADAAPDGQP